MDQEQTNTTNQINLRVETLILDEKIRSRLKLDERAIEEYAEEMMEGTIFPPITVYSDGTSFWVVDGFHRVKAAEQAGKTEITAHVTEGDYRKALLDSAGVNRTNGVRRTNEEKRHAVLKLLQDVEWKRWSDEVIAEKCGVSAPFVGTIREKVTPNDSESSQVRRGKDNRLYNTGKIGKRPRAEKSEISETAVEKSDQPIPVQLEVSSQDLQITDSLVDDVQPISPVVDGPTSIEQRPPSSQLTEVEPEPEETADVISVSDYQPDQPEPTEPPIKEESIERKQEEISSNSEEQKDEVPAQKQEGTSGLMTSTHEINDDIELLRQENQLLRSKVEELQKENATLREENWYLTGRVEHLEQMIAGCPE